MIDLHMHTNNSDGSDSVEELLKKAEELKLEYISITDHDTCNGYEVLKGIDVPKIYSGHIIPGIEIKCSYLKRNIEILGYKIDTDKMNSWMKEFYKDKQKSQLQTKYFNMLYEKCTNMGLRLTPKNEIVWNPNNDWASVTIYEDLKKYESNKEKVPEDLWESFRGFSKKYCSNPNHELYIDKSSDYPSLQEAINAVKECGGLVFLPHLFIYKWVDNKEQFIDDILKNYDIDGIECYHSELTDQQSQYLLNLCNEKKLYKSGGSDYHGTNKKDLEMAVGFGNLNINKELIEDWA